MACPRLAPAPEALERMVAIGIGLERLYSSSVLLQSRCFQPSPDPEEKMVPKQQGSTLNRAWTDITANNTGYLPTPEFLRTLLGGDSQHFIGGQIHGDHAVQAIFDNRVAGFSLLPGSPSIYSANSNFRRAQVRHPAADPDRRGPGGKFFPKQKPAAADVFRSLAHPHARLTAARPSRP